LEIEGERGHVPSPTTGDADTVLTDYGKQFYVKIINFYKLDMVLQSVIKVVH